MKSLIYIACVLALAYARPEGRRNNGPPPTGEPPFGRRRGERGPPPSGQPPLGGRGGERGVRPSGEPPADFRGGDRGVRPSGEPPAGFEGFGGRREGGRGGPEGRKHEGPRGQPCQESINGVVQPETSCFPSAYFVCEAVPTRPENEDRPRPTRPEGERQILKTCQPKPCDASCNCISGPPSEPDEADLILLALCGRNESCGREGGPGGPRGERPEGDRPPPPEGVTFLADFTRPTPAPRCEVPLAARLVQEACLVTESGSTVSTKKCPGPEGEEGTCSSVAACPVTLGSSTYSLYFCERPPRPTRQAPSGEQAPQNPSTGSENPEPLTEEDQDRPQRGKGNRRPPFGGR